MKKQIKKVRAAAGSAVPAVRSEEAVTPEVPSGAEKLASINEKLQGLLGEYMQLMPEAEPSTADGCRGRGCAGTDLLTKYMMLPEAILTLFPDF